MADEGAGQADQPNREAPCVHDLRRGDEEWDGQQHEFGRADHDVMNDRSRGQQVARIARHEGCEQHAIGDRDAQSQCRHERDGQEQGRLRAFDPCKFEHVDDKPGQSCGRDCGKHGPRASAVSNPSRTW